jgi:hypothetical protein
VTARFHFLHTRLVDVTNRQRKYSLDQKKKIKKKKIKIERSKEKDPKEKQKINNS